MILAEKQNSAKIFHEKMAVYVEEYAEYLLFEKSSGSSISHSVILKQFINFLWNKNLVSNLDEVTVAIANSGFYVEYKHLNQEVVSAKEIKEILSGFFIFLYGKHNIKNQELMNSLNK